jgi:hypothetical protein
MDPKSLQLVVNIRSCRWFHTQRLCLKPRLKNAIGYPEELSDCPGELSGHTLKNLQASSICMAFMPISLEGIRSLL